ncbi:MAG: amidohydrolase family protein, partial [Rhodospirillaceae bacterium]|nr:amidohydrolase family protein [Rhodospirillaceae bacterium]
MTTPRNTWLELTIEDPIEPDMPILDPHHHFWERPGDVYLLENLLADTRSGHRVNQTVFVECHSMYRTEGPEEMRSVGEVEFVEGIAAANVAAGGETAVAAGIVGNADMMLGDGVAPVREALAEAGKGRFKGIRCTAAWDASPEITTARANSAGMLANAEFRKGRACLERMGLSFDCIVYHPQLREVADMARALPDLTVILNHVGRPLGIGPYAGRREELMPEWRAGIDAVAEGPSVVMKVGGLGNPISGFDWHQRPFPPGSGEIVTASEPYYLYSIEKFGADRCMFESNFP